MILVASEQALTFAAGEAWCRKQGLELLTDTRLADEYCDTSAIWLGAASVSISGGAFAWQMSTGGGSASSPAVAAQAAPTALGQCLQLDRNTDTISNVPCTGTKAVVCSGSKARWVDPTLCPEGWHLEDGYCLRYTPTAASYLGAAQACAADNALLYSPGMSTAVDEWVTQAVLTPSTSQPSIKVHAAVDPTTGVNVYTGESLSPVYTSVPGASDRLAAALVVGAAVQYEPFSDGVAVSDVGTVCQRTAGSGSVFLEELPCPSGWLPADGACSLALAATFSGASPPVSVPAMSDLCKGAGGHTVASISDVTGGVVEISDPSVVLTVHPLAAVAAHSFAVDQRFCLYKPSTACPGGFEQWRGQCYQLQSSTVTLSSIADATSACTARLGGHIALPSSGALWDLLSSSAEWPAVAGPVVIGEAAAIISGETVVMSIGPEQWEEEPAREDPSGVGAHTITIATVSSAEWGGTRRVVHQQLSAGTPVTGRPVCAYPSSSHQAGLTSCSGADLTAEPYGCTRYANYTVGTPIDTGFIMGACMSRHNLLGHPHQVVEADNWKAFVSQNLRSPAVRAASLGIVAHSEWVPKVQTANWQTMAGRPAALGRVLTTAAFEPHCAIGDGVTVDGLATMDSAECHLGGMLADMMMCSQPYVNPCPAPFIYLRLEGSAGFGVTKDRCYAKSVDLGFPDATYATAETQCASVNPGLNSGLHSSDSSFESLFMAGLNPHATDDLWAGATLGFGDPDFGTNGYVENFFDWSFGGACTATRVDPLEEGFYRGYYQGGRTCTDVNPFACEMDVPAGQFTGNVARLVAEGHRPLAHSTWPAASHPYTQGYTTPDLACTAPTPTPSPAAATPASTASRSRYCLNS